MAENRLEGWRGRVLAEFPQAGGVLFLVSDPDGVLADEPLQTALMERGYEVLPYEDPMVFRAQYERSWRNQLGQRGMSRSLIVALKKYSAKPGNQVPVDVLSVARLVNLSLAQLVPKLAPEILVMVGVGHLDALWDALKTDDAGQRGPESTQDFVLTKVFGVDTEAILKARRPTSRLLTQFLPYHFRGMVLPTVLARRVQAQLSSAYALQGWPLAELMERAGFLAFLQRQWRVWVLRLLSVDRVSDQGTAEPERLDVPFDDPEVGVWMDTFFLNGLLTPVTVPAGAEFPRSPAWLVVGVEQNPRKDAEERLKKLLKQVEIPNETGSWPEWLRLAQQLAEATALAHLAELGADAPLPLQIKTAWEEGDRTFLPWMLKRFGGLSSLPHNDGPVMVHHVPRFMVERRGENGRVALLVLDGLALDQWAILKTAMPPFAERVLIEEGAAFAWIPTLTSVSRQAIFAGQPPYTFAKNIYATSGEASVWKKFWDDHRARPAQIRYLGVIDPDRASCMKGVLEDDTIRVVGAVIGLVDNLIHEWPLPRSQLAPTLTGWAKAGHLSRLIGQLLLGGFEVFLTADHGNREAIGAGLGIGNTKLPDIRGQRAQVYPNETLREQGLARMGEAVRWPGYGLPDDFLTVLAPGSEAFAREGERLVGHGGASLQEVIVPFVHFRRGER